MHYYQFNISDYQSHTRHLTPIEDICYRRMLDWVYLHEKPLPINPADVARILILNDCLTDVERVLNEFFTPVEQGWVNLRALAEIDLFNERLEKASKAGKASAEARKNKIKQSLANGEQPLNMRSTTVQPNKKQETRNNNTEITALSMLMAMGLSEKLSKEWLLVRKTKKLAPTQTAFDSIKKHAEKHGYTFEQAVTISITKSWGGFDVSWLKNVNDVKHKETEGFL